MSGFWVAVVSVLLCAPDDPNDVYQIISLCPAFLVSPAIIIMHRVRRHQHILSESVLHQSDCVIGLEIKRPVMAGQTHRYENHHSCVAT